MMEVEIRSRKLVAPSSPTQHHLRSFKISAMDQAERHSIYPSFISFYHFNNGTGQLERSLSEILTVYYPLAGRFLDEEKNIVTCNDRGAEFVEAEVVNNVRIAQLQLQSDSNASQLNLLVPEPCLDDWPLLLVQVTVFGCGGVAIGVRFSHRVADGYSMALFFSGWATASRFGLRRVAPLSLELPSFFPLRDHAHRIKSPRSSKIEAGRAFVTTRLVFDKAAIQCLRDAMRKDEKRKGPSRVVSVMAFIWRSYIRVAQAKHGYMRPSSQYIAVNMRPKTTLPIPPNSFGNFFTYAIARFAPATGELPELHELAALLQEAVEEAVARCAKQHNTDEMFTMVAGSNQELGKEVDKDGADVYGLASWCGFPFGEADFGWGKPTWVGTMAISVPITRLIDTVDGEGIEAWLSLQEDEMSLLRHDPNTTMGLASPLGTLILDDVLANK